MPANFTPQEIHEVLSSLLIHGSGSWETLSPVSQESYRQVAEELNHRIVQQEASFPTTQLIHYLYADEDDQSEILNHMDTLRPDAEASEVAMWLQASFAQKYEDRLDMGMIYWDEVAAEFMAHIDGYQAYQRSKQTALQQDK